MSKIDEIIILFKTHLDIGYTDFARNVRESYMKDFIPKAMGVARQLREEGGQARFVWTTGSWLIDEYLRSAAPADRQTMVEAIRAGDIRWHGLPFTTHTELMDAELFQSALDVAGKLDREFGKRTIAAKLTDVPGHTRGIVPHLARAGIEFLHIGVNPVSTSPSVPPLFRWRAPGGEEVTVMYNFGYGSYMPIPGTDKAMYFAHVGDNGDTQSAQAVRDLYRRLGEKYPGVRLRAGTLDDIALALRESREVLPCLDEEIGDTWIHGVQTDPAKTSQFRALLRLRREWEGEDREHLNRELLMIPEHTWGLDYRRGLLDHQNYIRIRFEQVRATPPYQLMEATWQEQRDYIARAVDTVSPVRRDQARAATQQWRIARPDLTQYRRVEDAQQPITIGDCTLALAADGGIAHLTLGGRQVADKDAPLAVFHYEALSRRETDRFCESYMDLRHFPELKELGIEDFNKIAQEEAISQALTCNATLGAVYANDREVLAMLEVDSPAAELYGCPASLMLALRPEGDSLHMDFAWWDKPATRVSEGLWLRFLPRAGNCRVRKLGQWIDPLGVVAHGNRRLHGTDWGVAFDGLCIETLDTPLVHMGYPNLWDFNDKQPDMSQGIYFNLYNNFWNTNFPLWYDGDARFRFVLRLEGAGQAGTVVK